MLEVADRAAARFGPMKARRNARMHVFEFVCPSLYVFNHSLSSTEVARTVYRIRVAVVLGSVFKL